jgi:hypothetical protein
MVKQVLGTMGLAMLLGCVLFCIPLVRSLVWVNAAVIAVHFHSPGLFVPIGILEVIVMVGILWGLFWIINRRWREVNHV